VSTIRGFLLAVNFGPVSSLGGAATILLIPTPIKPDLYCLTTCGRISYREPNLFQNLSQFKEKREDSPFFLVERVEVGF
jgi:hypothetical protein